MDTISYYIIIHKNLAKGEPKITKICLSKSTCFKKLNQLQNLNLIRHLKLVVGFSVRGCGVHQYYKMYQPCKFGDVNRTRNYLHIIIKGHQVQKP